MYKWLNNDTITFFWTPNYHTMMLSSWFEISKVWMDTPVFRSLVTSAVGNPPGWLLKVFINSNTELSSDDAGVGPCKKINVIKITGGSSLLVLVIQVREATVSHLLHPLLNGQLRFDTPGQKITERSTDTIIGAWTINWFPFEPWRIRFRMIACFKKDFST